MIVVKKNNFMQKYLWVFCMVLLTLITAFGDFMVKKGASQAKLLGNYWVFGAAVIYGLTAFGWFFVLQRVKLASAATLFNLLLLALVIAMSVFYFKEKLNLSEIVGIGLAFLSIIFLTRFV